MNLSTQNPFDELRSISAALESTAVNNAKLPMLFSRIRDWIAMAEHRHERSKSLYHSLVDRLPINVTRKDREGKITFVNGPFCELVGKSEAELLGKTDYDLFPKELADKYLSDDAGVFSTGQTFHAIEENQAGGRPLFFEVWKVPVRNADGTVVESQAVFWDVTEREENRIALARERDLLRSARLAADAANRAKSTFLANMSHEIRTPLYGVIGITDLLITGVPAQDLQNYLEIVRDSGELLMQLVNDILDFSKIEAGRLTLEETEIDLQAVMGSALKPLAIRAHQAGIELCCDIDPTIPTYVFADPVRLRQVITNLVGNAIKFTHQGEVVLKVLALEQDENTIELSIRVEDTGIGIPADKIDHIFEAFAQADSSTTRLYGGTGLGLAISSKLVEAMGSKLQCESQLGVGTTFQFRLKTRIGDSSCRSQTPSRPTSLRILVVEPHSASRNIISRILQSHSISEVSVSTADQALVQLQLGAREQAPFQCVIADASIGIGAMRAANPMTRGIRVIELVKAGATDRPSDLTSDLDQRLMKPATNAELIHAIDSLPSVPHQPGTRSNRRAGVEIPTLKVLLAEDGEVNQLIAKAVLEREKHVVKIVTTGRQAVDASANEDFDLILMDVQMPEMDGIDATISIRQRERQTGRHIPIIAMTAGAMPEDEEACLNAGMDGYLSKPMREETLRSAIRQHIRP